MTMSVSTTDALPCESTTFDYESPSATCNLKGTLSPAASMISTAPNTPSAEANIQDKAFPKLPAEIQTTEFDDSDDEEGLPGYPSWGSSWTMRSLRTPDNKPAKSPTMFHSESPMAGPKRSFNLDEEQ